MVGMKVTVGSVKLDRPAASRRLGRYRIVEKVVDSAFARIFRAVGPDGRVVAVKLFHPGNRVRSGSGYSVDQWRQRFLSEAGLLAALHHPHVTPVLDQGEAPDGQPFFVMPWMAANLRREIGRDVVAPSIIARLAEHERPRAVTPARALAVVRQLAEGLAALHEAGIVHRDVKPTNLLLSARQDGDVALCDLGMARLPEDRHSSRSGVWVGTPNYMPPEQRDDAATVSDRADVFAMGMLGYRILVGRLPAGAFRRADELVPGTPAEFGILLNRCLAPAPEDRPGAAEVAAELARLQRT
jgi:serine/threonine protein kinase